MTQQALQHREEAVDQVVEWLALLLNCALKSLDYALESAKTGDNQLLVVGCEPLVDGIEDHRLPLLKICLGNVVDDVFDA